MPVSLLPRRLALPLACALALATPVLADAEASWEAFRADVEAECLSLLIADGTVEVEVNPFGSEAYGVAIITVTGPNGTDRLACVYDKATKAAELTAAFAPIE